MPKGKNLKTILVQVVKPKGLDGLALTSYESGHKKGFSQGFEEGRRIGHEEGAKAWAEAAAAAKSDQRTI